MTRDQLTIETLPLPDRAAAWHGALAEWGIAARPAEGDVPPGGSVTALRSASGARLGRLAAGPQHLSGLAAPGCPAAADAILCVLHLSGRARLYGAGRAIEVADGDLAVFDLGAAWRCHFRTDFDVLALEVPRERFLARLGRVRLALPAVLGETVAAAAARPVMRALATHFDVLDQADLVSAETALVELVASALMAEAGAGGDASSVQAAHRRRLAAAIEARLAEPSLSVADVAREAGLSPRYVQRLFERHGETFSDYLRLRRLDRCRADMRDPRAAEQSIGEIAFRWGFRDQAHFSRAFSTAFGQPPREFRKRATSAEAAVRHRGRPGARSPGCPPRDGIVPFDAAPRASAGAPMPEAVRPRPPAGEAIRLPVTPETVHWGFISRTLPPVLRVDPGAVVTVETLTQHAYDDHARMIAGDAAAEAVFRWTAEGKAVDRRGAGPMNASLLGRGAGEGFGVHICTGPIHVRGAEPGDTLEIEILDLAPRPCANPAFAGKAFASNAAAWWGYQYGDLVHAPGKREVVTIYAIDLDAEPGWARPVYSYRWTAQTDPFGVRHETMDYPGVPVDHATVVENHAALAGVRVPVRPHFGFVGVAPREADIVDSIPPGYFGGNVDNWRAGKGARIYLPVAVPGALLSVGDPHLAQGDGEIDGTALEGSLTGVVRLRLHKRDGDAPGHLKGLAGPLIETPEAFVLQGFSYSNYLRELGRGAQTEVYRRSSVDLALRNAFRLARRFLMERWGLDEDEAVSLLSVAVDFGITQVADGNWGVHAVIRKDLFAEREASHRRP